MLADASRRRALALLATLMLAACARKPAFDAVPRGATVLALGDSLTYGTGASPQTSYPAVLAELTGWNVANAGVPGETAAQICARLSELLAAHRPRLVLLLAGGNDFLRRLPDDGVRAALRDCAASAHAASVPLVLLPVPRLGLGGLAHAPLYEEVATSLRVPLLDAGLAQWLGSPAMRADAVHLNAAGYRAMAARVAEGLRKLGLLD